jgi:hypothetical protein
MGYRGDDRYEQDQPWQRGQGTPRRSPGYGSPAVPQQFQQGPPRQDGTRGYPAGYGQPEPWQQAYQPPAQQYRATARPAPRHRQGGGYGPWIAVGAVVLAAVGGGAFYVLHGRASAPLTCPQQYQAWKTGPAKSGGEKVVADAKAISAAGKSVDIAEMDSSLKTLGADASALEAYPMPACADPGGYWKQYLGAMKAAGDNAGTASGLGGLILAEAPLKQVPAIQSKLTAELAKTAGVKPTS